MHDVLGAIVRAKRRELEEARHARPLRVLEKSLARRTTRAAFREALVQTGRGIAIIAELKKASPSRGVIRADYDPAAIATSYEQAGARALSVLTDAEFFQGSLDHLRQARRQSSLPLLRKDFTLDSYQIYEAAEAGADAVLLIAAILSPAEIGSLLRTARELKLDAIVEVHTPEELAVALDAGAEIIGVNNRNLKTFRVTLETSLSLIDSIPETVTAISESGLRTSDDLARLSAAGFDAFLIGEHFMADAEPGRALRQLLAGIQQIPARELGR